MKAFRFWLNRPLTRGSWFAIGPTKSETSSLMNAARFTGRRSNRRGKPNRGGDTGSLFQINHWIETTPAPRPSNAALVNAYDFLLQRARDCQKARGHLPNIIGVDFYDTGDLMRVARTLNGLPDSLMLAKSPSAP